MREQVGFGLPGPFPSLAPAPAAAQNTASICQCCAEPARGTAMNGQRGLGHSIAGSCQSRRSRGVFKIWPLFHQDTEPALRGREIEQRGDNIHGNKASKKADPVGWLRPPKRGTGVTGAWWGRRRGELLKAVPSGRRGRGEAGLPHLAAQRARCLTGESSRAPRLSLHSHARMRLKGKEDKSHSSLDAIGCLQPESSQRLHSHSGT